MESCGPPRAADGDIGKNDEKMWREQIRNKSMKIHENPDPRGGGGCRPHTTPAVP